MQIPTQVSSPVTTGMGSALTPETEGFDFLNCLLGLQESDQSLPTLSPSPGFSPESELGLTEPLKEKDSSWEESLSGAASVGSSHPLLTPLNIPIPKAEGSEILAATNSAPKAKTILPASFSEGISLPEGMRLENSRVTPEVPANVEAHSDSTAPNRLASSANLSVPTDGWKSEAVPSTRPFTESAAPRVDFQLDAKSVPNPETDRIVQAKAAAVYRSASNQPLNRPAEVASAPTGAMAMKSEFGRSEEPPVLKRRSASEGSEAFSASDLFSTSGAVKNDAVVNSPAVSPPSASPGTPIPEIFNQVESMALQGGGKVTVAIDPPDLGRVEIQVITRGKKVEIAMTSDSERARGILEGGLGNLKHSLESQDLTLTHSEVRTMSHGFSNQSTGDFRNFGGNGQTFAHHENRHKDGGGLGGSIPLSRAAMSPVAASANPRSHSGTGRVDLRI